MRKSPNLIGSFDAIHAQARDALGKGRLAEAEDLCLSALRVRPHDPGILNLIGQTQLGLNRPSEAAANFELAIQRSPKLANLYYNLALARQAEGRLSDAIQAVRSAIDLDPSVPVLHGKLGQLLGLAGANTEAVSTLEHALKLDPKSVPVRINLTQALLDLGDLTGAEESARAALSLNPKDANGHRMLGRIHQTNGRFAEASACFEASIKWQPIQAASYFALVYSKRISPPDHDLVTRMIELLSNPRLNESDRGLLNYALGKAHDDLGEYDSAMGHFTRANDIALAALNASGTPYDADFESKKVDRLIELFPQEDLNNESVNTVSRQPIFIVGMIRSGTTLVEQILSRHPDVCACGELKYWTENEARMHYELASKTSNIDPWRAGYETVLDGVSTSASNVTDKMPLNFWSLGLIRLAYPNAKIIHCKRNPLDTCLSIYVTPYRRGPEFGHDLQNIGNAYGNYLRLMDHWRIVIPASKLLEVEYEDLVASPEVRVREMIEFLGLNWNDACLDPNAGSTTVQTPSQWQVRQPVYRNSVNRWQSYARVLGPVLELGLQ